MKSTQFLSISTLKFQKSHKNIVHTLYNLVYLHFDITIFHQFVRRRHYVYITKLSKVKKKIVSLYEVIERAATIRPRSKMERFEHIHSKFEKLFWRVSPIRGPFVCFSSVFVSDAALRCGTRAQLKIVVG